MKTATVEQVCRWVLAGCGMTAGSGLLGQAATEAAWMEAWTLDGRIRWEQAEMDGLADSEALTARVRLGLKTPVWNDVVLFAEGEFSGPLESDSYDAYPGGQGEPGHAVIADPRTVELNRLQATYTWEEGMVVLGRQRILRNNVRFIGNVGWRQNEQTFDAVLSQFQPTPDIELIYAYLNRANRIFGKYADVESQRYFDMKSHLVEAKYTGFETVEAGFYGYLLRIENSPGASSDTMGAWLTGKNAVTEDIRFVWRVELAKQSDNHQSPDGSDFDLDYYHVMGGLHGKTLSVDFGLERLEGENGRGFSTPLATLHAFNGFADVFLSTPGRGLLDAYVKVSGVLPGGVKAAVVYHQFESGEGSVDYGEEWDAVASWKLNKNVSFTGKIARYSGDAQAPSGLDRDVNKLWIQVDLSY